MKIVLIGSGNVATHLGKAISALNGYPISQIFSKTKANAKLLADKLHCEYTNSLHEIIKNGDLYILAISDDQIKPTAAELNKHLPKNSLVVHTSGSVESSVLASYFPNYGVLYPLQTFSKSRKMVYNNIPFLIVASSKKQENLLKSLSEKISKKVVVINDKDKAILHLAAVFVNNFSNELYNIAYSLITKHKLSFDILMPLMEETFKKLESLTPTQAQTGPARRNDLTVIAKHKKLLQSESKDWLHVYDTMTESISNKYNKKNA